jgi:hypothetical protein
MTRNRLGFVALGTFSLFLLGCPAPEDNAVDGGGAGGSGGATGGRGGSSGGSGGSGSGGSGGAGTGGAAGGTGGATGGTGGATGGTGGATGGAGGRGGTGGATGGTGGAGTGGAGTGGSGMADARPPDTMMTAGTKLPPAIATIFMTRCANNCHNSEYVMAASAYTRLKGMAGAPCSRPRMVPNMGAMSLVVLAMKGMKPCGNAMRMPPNGTAVPAAEITMVEEWINGGAIPVP